MGESNDLEFYSSPKFVYHLDSNFRKELTNIYNKEICSNSTVLDLMSSWDSYLPTTKSYKKVIGHGLNKEELDRNKYFDKYWIQNFNKDQNIPLESESIDYCLMVAAWQYLQYPENIATEISRILKSNGKLVLEIGYDQKSKIISLLKKRGFYINNIIKDYAKNDRCIISTKIN